MCEIMEILGLVDELDKKKPYLKKRTRKIRSDLKSSLEYLDSLSINNLKSVIVKALNT